MNKFILLSTLAAFTVSAGIANAATVTNSDKSDVILATNIGGKVENVTLKENGVYDSKGKDVGLAIGTEKPVLAKADDHFIIKGGKLEVKPVSTDVKAEVKTEAAPVTLSKAAEPVKLETAAKVAAPATATK